MRAFAGLEQSPVPAPAMMAPESGLPRGNGEPYAGASRFAPPLAVPLLPAASTTMIPESVANETAS